MNQGLRIRSWRLLITAMHWFFFVGLLLWLLLGGSPKLIASPPPLRRIAVIALKGPVGKLDHLALDSRRMRLFVANTVNGSLDVVDLSEGKLLRQIPGQAGIQGIDYAPDIDRIFVGNSMGGICNVFDGADYHLWKMLPLGGEADNVRYNQKTRRVYVVHADQELAVIHVDNYTIGSPIALPQSLGAFQVESSSPRMFANAKVAGMVVAIDAEKGQVIGRFLVAPATVNAALAIDEANRRLFVGCRHEPTLVVIDSENGQIKANVPIPGDVDDVFYDARRKRIYASCGDGAIAVIRQDDADHYEPPMTVPTARGARTSLLDPTSGRVYVAVPRHVERPEQVDPEIWIYEATP